MSYTVVEFMDSAMAVVPSTWLEMTAQVRGLQFVCLSSLLSVSFQRVLRHIDFIYIFIFLTNRGAYNAHGQMWTSGKRSWTLLCLTLAGRNILLGKSGTKQVSSICYVLFWKKSIFVYTMEFVLLLDQKSSPYTDSYDLADKKCLQYMENSCPDTDDCTVNSHKRVHRTAREYSSSEGEASSVWTESCGQLKMFPCRYKIWSFFSDESALQPRKQARNGGVRESPLGKLSFCLSWCQYPRDSSCYVTNVIRSLLFLLFSEVHFPPPPSCKLFSSCLMYCHWFLFWITFIRISP